MISRLLLLSSVLVILVCISASHAASQGIPDPEQNGPHHMGTIILEFVDASRDDRQLQATLWYPADNTLSERPFPAELSEAPYPLIIWSHGYGDSPIDGIGMVRHLVSLGYVVAGISHPDQIEVWDWPEVDRPLDDLFVLDQLGQTDDERLAGLIDTNNVGVIGFSWGATGALQVAGARVDPEGYVEWCESDPASEQSVHCDITVAFDQLQSYQAVHIPLAEDGLWSATTDPRIRAAIALSPCAGHAFGERGMAGVAIPVFVSAATEDAICTYVLDGKFMFDHIDQIDRYLLTLEGEEHAGIWREDDRLVSFFTAAFLGYYLKGITEYRQFLSPEGAERFANITLETREGEG